MSLVSPEQRQIWNRAVNFFTYTELKAREESPDEILVSWQRIRISSRELRCQIIFERLRNTYKMDNLFVEHDESDFFNRLDRHFFKTHHIKLLLLCRVFKERDILPIIRDYL